MTYMRTLLTATTALAAICFVPHIAEAQAATTITVSPFDLFQGARKLGSYATAAECSAAAQQLIGRTPNAAFHSA